MMAAVRAGARVLGRVDRMIDDAARDLGAVQRDTRALLATVRARGRDVGRATPRVGQLAAVASRLGAHARWLRLRAAARGQVGLTDDDHAELARRAVAELSPLRGAVVKLGQLASTRPDLVGAAWARELAALQDRGEPVPAAAIRGRVEAELGAPIAELFATFDDTPLAVASIAQVHAATTFAGVDVVVKVQVPGVEALIAADVAALEVCARLLPDLPGVDLPTVAAELHRCLQAELDYAREAEQLRAFAREAPPHVLIPRVVEERSAARVLTMSRLRGTPLTAWLDARVAAGDLAARDRLLGALVGEVVAQLLTRGHLHGDLHAGNVLVTDAGQLALLDFGCTLRLGDDERRGYGRLLAALATGDAPALPAALTDLGFVADEPAALGAAVALMAEVARPGVATDAVDWAALTARQLELVRGVAGLRVPPSFVLVGRVLAALGGLLATYRPAIDVHALLLPHVLAALAPASAAARPNSD